MADIAADKVTIRELVENWALWRDARLWDRFRTVWHADGRMMATWFQGSFEEFIKVNDEGWARGVRILHFLGGSAIDVAGDRAIAQTKMTISQRAPVEGVICDVRLHRPLLRFLRKRDGRWGLVLRQPIYEKDRLDPVDPSAKLALDQDVLRASRRLSASRLSADQDRLQGEDRHARHRGAGTRRALCARRALAEGRTACSDRRSRRRPGGDFPNAARSPLSLSCLAPAPSSPSSARLIERRASAARPLHRDRRICASTSSKSASTAGAADGAGRAAARRRLQSGRHASGAWASGSPPATGSYSVDRPGLGFSARKAGEGDHAGLSGGRIDDCTRPAGRRARHRGRPFLGRHAGADIRARLSAARRRACASRRRRIRPAVIAQRHT